MSDPVVTLILATHDRGDVVRKTIERLLALPDRVSREVHVVDNASCDGTARMVAARFPQAHLTCLRRNLGSCAKSAAVPLARGRYVVFLDDDSYPRPWSIDRMVDRFRADDRLGAAGFTVHLPDGRLEGAALPGVFVGCGVGLRADALRAVGGLDPGLFMQAEEYDLAFRLVGAGWSVDTFEDLHVEHAKTPQARVSARTTFFDTRNNLLVAHRYLPEPYHRVYAQDWTQRYRWLASSNGHTRAFLRGVAAAWVKGGWDRRRYAGQRLSPAAFEELFRLDQVGANMGRLRREGAKLIVFAPLGKNMYAFHCAAERAGLKVAAVADDRFARRGRFYRGLPIVPTEQANRVGPDVVVVSDMGPVHAVAARDRLATLVKARVLCWFGQAERGVLPMHESRLDVDRAAADRAMLSTVRLVGARSRD